MKILETQHLTLRTWEDNDLDAMAEINQDPSVFQYLLGPLAREETHALIQQCINYQEAKGFSLYAVELKTTQEMIDFLGLITPSFEAPFTPAIEIGITDMLQKVPLLFYAMHLET